MECNTSNLAYSGSPPTQKVVAETQWLQYPCLTNVSSSGAPLEFRIDRTNAYTDINQMYIHVQVKITKTDGTTLVNEDSVSTANGLGYSMFSAVDMYIQDQKVTQEQTMYPWMAYTKLLSSCTKNELKYMLKPALWIKDDAALFDVIGIEGALRNKGYTERAAYVQRSITTDLVAKVLLDFAVDRLIPNQTEISLRFHRAPSSQCLLAKTNEFKLNIVSATLMVPKVTLTETGHRLSTRVLHSGGMRYPTTRLVMRSKAIGMNDQNCEWIPFTGKLPKRIFLFQVSQAAFNGDISKNIFNYQTFELKNLRVTRNDQSIPFASGVDIDWSNPNVLYMMSALAIGDADKLHYSTWEFANGYGVICFDLTDNHSASANYRDERQQGTLKVQLDYNEPLTEGIVVICMAEFDDTLTIDQYRNPHWE
jgi:hypothetical protein